MTTRKTAPKAAPTAAASAPQPNKRHDVAQAHVRSFLSQHGVSVDAFTADHATALVEAIDSAK